MASITVEGSTAEGFKAVREEFAAGAQSFADPRSGLTYGYNRRRFAFPGGAAPENVRLVGAVHAAAIAR